MSGKTRERKDCIEFYLTGEIVPGHLRELRNILADAEELKRPVRVWICSIGGDLLTACALHDALATLPDVEVVGSGSVQSAALIVFLGAAKRSATPSTLFLRHEIQGNQPFPMDLPALRSLRSCPEGYFDVSDAIEHGVITVVHGAPGAAHPPSKMADGERSLGRI